MKLHRNENILRALALLLCAVMVALPMLTGCEPSPEPPVYDTRLNFLTPGGLSVYRVVYPKEDCPQAVQSAAEELQGVMQEVLGTEVAITDDKGTANANDQFQPYEILIGRTARTASQKVLPELDGEEYVIRVDGHKIVIVGATNRATYAGVRYFIDTVIRSGEVVEDRPVVKIEKDYDYQGKYVSPTVPAEAGNTKLPVAPYKVAVLYTVAQPTKVADQITLATLQGLSTLYSSEQVFVVRPESEAQLAALIEQGVSVTDHNDEEQLWTLGRLLNYYCDRLQGYILCSGEVGSQSMAVAINLAHQLRAVVVTPENEEVAQAAGLSCVADVTDRDDAWLRATPYFEKMNRNVAVEPDTDAGLAFLDYVVMTGCYYYNYCSGDEYMHIQSFKHLEKGAYILTQPGDDVHHTITFESIGVDVLTPSEDVWSNLSVLISADPQATEKLLGADD